MEVTDFIQRVNSALLALPVSKEPFFTQLWEKKRLSYGKSSGQIDNIDEIGAKLICTALEKSQLFLNVLPDYQEHRGAVIFGTALLRSAVDCINNNKANHRVLYYGTTAGFKQNLSNTSVQGMELDSVFNSIQVSGKYRKMKPQGIYSEHLPQVVCVYHPAEPEQYIKIYDPDWIAIDCGQEESVDWIKELLAYCKKKFVPCVGWCQNNFSTVIEEFIKHDGRVFYSPKFKTDNALTGFADLWINQDQFSVTPVILTGNGVDDIDKLLNGAKAILRGIKSGDEMKIKSDAFKAIWRFLKQLERLSLPLDIYNAEAKAFWGTHSLSEMMDGVKRYISLINDYDSNLASQLSRCFVILIQIYSRFEKEQPPYWSVLSNYCTDRSPLGALRVLVFPSRSQKRLFSYTLLSRCNISENELLTDSGILLKTFKELLKETSFGSEITKKYKINLILLGLPDHYNKSRFYQALNKFETKVLLYSHQVGALKTILNSFSNKDQNQAEISVAALWAMSGRKDKVVTPVLPNRFLIDPIFQKLTVSQDKVIQIKEEEYRGIVEIGDVHTELAKMFESVDEDEDSECLISISMDKQNQSNGGGNNTFVLENALKISFEGGYSLLVDPTEKISTINGTKIIKVYTRAIKNGSLVLCIENQIRKDLFDLLVDRIHDHRSLSLHINLLQKWREEFYLSYQIWKDVQPGMGLDEFCQLLREKGSDVESPLTISNWLHGHTLRPHDTLNIRRVGQVLGNGFVTENFNEISNAAKRIVGLHISLSKRLKIWLEGKAFDFKKDDFTVVDKELDLTLGELRSSLKILKVTDIKVFSEPVLRSTIGILQK
jgi:hypothetical protein